MYCSNYREVTPFPLWWMNGFKVETSHVQLYSIGLQTSKQFFCVHNDNIFLKTQNGTYTCTQYHHDLHVYPVPDVYEIIITWLHIHIWTMHQVTNPVFWVHRMVHTHVHSTIMTYPVSDVYNIIITWLHIWTMHQVKRIAPFYIVCVLYNYKYMLVVIVKLVLVSMVTIIIYLCNFIHMYI